MPDRASWRLRKRFVGITCLLIALIPFLGLEASLFIVPFVFSVFFTLPNLWFPDHIKIGISEDGIDYQDFSQIIHASWSCVQGIDRISGQLVVTVDHPQDLANFSIFPSHPMAKELSEAIKARVGKATD